MNYIEKQLKSRNILSVFLTVIMLGLAVMLSVLRYQEELKWREVQSWQKLPATVVSHQEKTSRNGKNNYTYSEITYRCQVGNRTYFGHDCGVGGRTLLPKKFHKRGAKVECYFNPRTKATRLAYYDNDFITFIITCIILFSGAATVASSIWKNRNFDTKTVPPEFAARLSPVPELSGRFSIRKSIAYLEWDGQSACPGIILLPRKDKANIFRSLFFLAITLFLLIIGLFPKPQAIMLFYAGVNFVFFICCFKKRPMLFLDPIKKIFYQTGKADKIPSAKKQVPFSAVQAVYLIWLVKSNCMGLLLQTQKGNIILYRQDSQQLMRDAVKLVNLIDPALPMYDLLHREFDPKYRQGYCLL